MTDRMTRTVAEKMGVRPNARTYFLEAPAPVVASMQMPALDVRQTLAGAFDHIHAFTTTQAHMTEQLPRLRKALAVDGALWLSWPKGGQLGTDLTLPDVIRIGYDHGLVESKCISVDLVWSALKFTNPIEGKAYYNSHGRLPKT